MFELDLGTLELLAGVFIPILVGIVTREVTSPAIKAWLLAALSAVTGVVVAAQQAGGFVTEDALVAGLVTMVISVATYYGFWKPTGTANLVQRKTDAINVPPGSKSSG